MINSHGAAGSSSQMIELTVQPLRSEIVSMPAVRVGLQSIESMRDPALLGGRSDVIVDLSSFQFQKMPTDLKIEVLKQVVIHAPEQLAALVSKEWSAMGSEALDQVLAEKGIQIDNGDYLLNTMNDLPMAPFEMCFKDGTNDRGQNYWELTVSKDSIEPMSLICVRILKEQVQYNAFREIQKILHNPPIYQHSAEACKNLQVLCGLELEGSNLRTVLSPEIKSVISQVSSVTMQSIQPVAYTLVAAFLGLGAFGTAILFRDFPDQEYVDNFNEELNQATSKYNACLEKEATAAGEYKAVLSECLSQRSMGMTECYITDVDLELIQKADSCFQQQEFELQDRLMNADQSSINLEQCVEAYSHQLCGFEPNNHNIGIMSSEDLKNEASAGIVATMLGSVVISTLPLLAIKYKGIIKQAIHEVGNALLSKADERYHQKLRIKTHNDLVENNFAHKQHKKKQWVQYKHGLG